MFFGLFNKKKKRFLFNRDVTEYHYLGITKLTIHEKGNTSNIIESAYVYMFCGKYDYSVRMCVLSGGTTHNFENHSWMHEVIAPWMIGEYSLSYPIMDKPSVFLEHFMHDTHNAIWVGGKEKWHFRKSLAIIPNIIGPEIKKEEDNVIRVSFPPTKKDVDTEKTI